MSDSQYIRFPFRTCALQQALANGSLTQELNAYSVPSPEACEKAIMAGESLSTFHEEWWGWHPEWESYRDGFGSSLLHIAAQKNNALSILFLTHSINHDVRDSKGRTPLHTAAECSDALCVLALILSGADVNAYDHRRETPIFYAVRARNAEALEILLQHRAAPRARNAAGKTAEDLIEEGADHLRDIFNRYK